MLISFNSDKFPAGVTTVFPSESALMKISFSFNMAWILLLSIFSCTASAQQEKLLILGDSISAAYGISPEKSWVKLLQDKLNISKKNILLINASVSGATTSNMLNTLPNQLKKYHPDSILIELGGNDGLRGIELAIIKDNLKKIMLLAQQQSIKIYLVEMDLPANYGKRYRDLFKSIYIALAKEFNAILITNLFEKVGKNPKLMQADGIHPNEHAQPIITEQIWQAITKKARE